jgi:hypothetical protein
VLTAVIESLHHLLDGEHERDARRERPAHLERIMSPRDLGQQLNRNHRENDAGCEVLDAASNDAAGRAQGCRRRAKECGADGDCGY